MLKETKAEETIVFFVTFLSLVAFQLGGALGPPTWLRLCLQLWFSGNSAVAALAMNIHQCSFDYLNTT